VKRVGAEPVDGVAATRYVIVVDVAKMSTD